MPGGSSTFFGITTALLVRCGEDEKLVHYYDSVTNKRYAQNTFLCVHSAMLLQICRDYSSLPDYRTLKAYEIRFFYDGLRAELKSATKPKG